jgi:hypothetical protein
LNEVTRTLSADNRATALKEGSKSAEVAEHLSSEKIYNSEGTQLLETFGQNTRLSCRVGLKKRRAIARSSPITKALHRKGKPMT